MINQEYLDFIHDHLDCDIHNLVLSYKSDSINSFDIKYAARLISSKQKLFKKMPFWASDKRLYFPSPTSAEQASSHLSAKNKLNLIKGGIVFDITGGIGVDTFYFAKVNKIVHYYEKEKELFESTRYNLTTLGSCNINFNNIKTVPQIIRGNIEKSLDENKNTDHLLYIDPSRRSEKGRKLKSIFEYEPDIREFVNYMRGLPIIIVIKLSPITDITEISRTIHGIVKFEIVSISNDCKEILVTINPMFNSTLNLDCIIEAKMIDKNGISSTFTFKQEEEKQIKPNYSSDIDNHKFLYEPDNAILNIGAFNTVANKYNLAKIAPNTHLYLSNTVYNSFPGKIFYIKKVVDYNKHTIRNLSHSYPKANISVRNFQLNSIALKKQLKIDDGGDISIFGCSLISDERKIIITSRIK